MKTFIAALVVGFLFFCTLANAQYMKLGDIKGEATAKSFKDWSNIQGFNQAMALPQSSATGQSRRRGSPKIEDIMVTKELDSAGPKIAEALLKGQIIATASFAFQASGQTYLAYELKNVQITSYALSYSEGRPVEQISISYEEISVSYKTMDPVGKPTGNVEYSWKVETGEK